MPYIYIQTPVCFLSPHNQEGYIYINCTVIIGLIVSDRSVFPTSFGRGRFQGNLFSFENHKWLQKIFI